MELTKPFTQQLQYIFRGSLWIISFIAFMSWVLFCVYSLHTNVAIFVILICSVLFFWCIIRFKPHRRFIVNNKFAALVWIISVALILMAPAYSYYSAHILTNRLVTALEIDAHLQERKIYLLDTIGDIGDGRRVVSRYIVNEPYDEARRKLEAKTFELEKWKLVEGENNEFIVASCDGRYNQPIYLTTLLNNSGELTLTIRFTVPRYCTEFG